MNFEFYNRPITSLPGVGRVKAGYFEKLGIRSLGELLYHFPRAYQQRGKISLLGEASLLHLACSTVLTVGSMPSSVRLSKGRVMTRFTAFDDSGKCTITFFNQPYIKDLFHLGMAFRFWGKVEKMGKNFSMSCPEFEPFLENKPLPEFYAVYPLTEGLTSKAVSTCIRLALSEAEKMPDPLPKEVLEAYQLPDLYSALVSVHIPNTYEELEKARRRFIFEELFLFSMGMLKGGKKPLLSPDAKMAPVQIEDFYKLLPFRLTSAQERTVSEIKKDMESVSTPMTRLVCGDVGSGKTVCAEAAIYIALQNGKQAALMVPTEILANQHYKEMSSLFEQCGYKVLLLTGSLTQKGKKTAREAIKNGDCDLVIGTQALITEDTVFHNLGLVITDEQHRFGVNQRAALSSKSGSLHTLVMTATPIPRTLALILYGDLAISYIDEMPPGRQKVATFTVNESYRTRLNGFIEKQAREGHQTYVVCPAVDADNDEESENTVPFDYDPTRETPPPLPLKSAVTFSKELSEALPHLKVGFVHGKMKAKEKDEVMAAFASGNLDVLVSTTVIEVGVNVPNATLMVVENAERFGLSQLHQLRGRVGRGKAKSYCVFVSEAKIGSTARTRLDTLCKTFSGYEIANEDLKIRGPGDFFPKGKEGVRQSGDFSFKLASSCTDANTPVNASMAAKAVLEEDENLEKEEHQALRFRLEKLFYEAKNTIN